MSPDKYSQWALVEQVFESGLRCHDCPQKHTEVEPHGEVSRYCALMYQPLSSHAEPDVCPGFEHEKQAFDSKLRNVLLEELRMP